MLDGLPASQNRGLPCNATRRLKRSRYHQDHPLNLLWNAFQARSPQQRSKPD
jgi:hypothetical protein